MRRIFLAALAVFLLSCVAVAQDFPKVEIFGGYSLMKLGGDDVNGLFDYWEEGNEQPGTSVSTSKWLKKGFMASAAFNTSEYFGIEANVQYNAGEVAEFNTVQNVEGEMEVGGKADASDFSFMAGPRFALRKNEAVTPFAHFLLGINRVSMDGTISSCSWNGEDCPSGFEEMMLEEAHMLDGSDTGFGFMLGGGVDVNLGDSVAVRLIEIDYKKAYHELGGPEDDEDFSMSNISLAFGFVLKF